MAEILIPQVRVTRDGVEHDTGVSDTGDGLYLGSNDGNITVFVSGNGDFHAVPAPAPTGWPSWEPDELTNAGEMEYGPWPPAVYNREDGTVLFEADAELEFTASGI